MTEYFLGSLCVGLVETSLSTDFPIGQEEEITPYRIHLRTKRSRRCKECQHNLIRPELKADSILFKIKHVAL